jgi:transposase
MLAIEAVNAGADRPDVAEVLGINPSTISNWLKQYREEGIGGLCRKPSSNIVRKQCTELEKRIVAHRTENPNHGVRRIRDELRLHEGLEVSTEKVRQTVNAAGKGNPPAVPHKRPTQVRRFERSLPNAMWQIDIFTFNLKRMYKVYLIGIIDDHSRYLVGWGLYRQQSADAVLEVVKGALKARICVTMKDLNEDRPRPVLDGMTAKEAYGEGMSSLPDRRLFKKTVESEEKTLLLKATSRDDVRKARRRAIEQALLCYGLMEIEGNVSHDFLLEVGTE